MVLIRSMSSSEIRRCESFFQINHDFEHSQRIQIEIHDQRRSGRSDRSAAYRSPRRSSGSPGRRLQSRLIFRHQLVPPCSVAVIYRWYCSLIKPDMPSNVSSRTWRCFHPAGRSGGRPARCGTCCASGKPACPFWSAQSGRPAGRPDRAGARHNLCEPAGRSPPSAFRSSCPASRPSRSWSGCHTGRCLPAYASRQPKDPGNCLCSMPFLPSPEFCQKYPASSSLTFFRTHSWHAGLAAGTSFRTNVPIPVGPEQIDIVYRSSGFSASSRNGCKGLKWLYLMCIDG